MKVYQIIAENETLNELGGLDKIAKVSKYASRVFKGPTKNTLGEPATATAKTTAKTATKISPSVANAAKESVSKMPSAVNTAIQTIGAAGIAYNYWSEYHANEESYKAYQKDPTADTGFQNKSPEDAWAMYQELQQEALGKLINELAFLIAPGVVAKVFKTGGSVVSKIIPIPFAGSPLTGIGKVIELLSSPALTPGRAGLIAFLEGTSAGRAVMANAFALGISGVTGRAAQAIMDTMSNLLQSYDWVGKNGVNTLGKGIGAVSAASKGQATEPPEVAASKANKAADQAADTPRELRVTKNGKSVTIGDIQVIDAQGKRIPGLEGDQARAQTVADALKVRNPWLDLPQT